MQAEYVKQCLCLSLSAETEFSLSLNGSELLTDTGQTLSSCGIVSGDLICVILPESAATDNTDITNTPTGSTENQRKEHNQQTAAMTTNQVSDESAEL